jgi:hypothetical protein
VEKVKNYLSVFALSCAEQKFQMVRSQKKKKNEEEMLKKN